MMSLDVVRTVRLGRFIAIYAALLMVVTVSFAVVLLGDRSSDVIDAGSAVSIPQPAASAHRAAEQLVLRVIAILAAILVLGRVIGGLCRRIGQPMVIGEILAGIILGPSVIGGFAPQFSDSWLTPHVDDPQRTGVLAALKAISQLGVVLYMFLVGVELNVRKIFALAQSAFAISCFGIAVPFLLGTILAWAVSHTWREPQVPFISFSLFLGVAMSITAFPVLARILSDRRLDQTDLGVLALSCAAADDLIAWCLLAMVVGVANSDVGNATRMVIAAMGYAGVMVLLIRPVLQAVIRRWEADTSRASLLPWLLIAALLSAYITEAIGIHAVFGAFLMGAFIPHDSRVARQIRDHFHEVVTLLLLPAFFALSGMNTRIGLIGSLGDWLNCSLIILVATLGKFGGAWIAARAVSLDNRTACVLGVLMNTRGLMELIVLNIGLSLGVISPKLFTMMVIMALVTTFATGPILTRLIPDSGRSAA